MTKLSNYVDKNERPEDNLGAGPEALPRGWYTGKITDADIVGPSGRGTVQLKLEMDVFEPVDYAGRKVWHRITLSIEKAKLTEGQKTHLEIAKAERNQLFVAAGFNDAPPEDTGELVGKYVEFKTKHDKDDEYGDENGNVARVVAFRVPNNTTQAPDVNAGGPDDDDIPF